MAKTLNLPAILRKHGAVLLEEWSKELDESAKKDRRLSSSELRKQARELLENIQQAASNGNVNDLERPEWESVNSLLEEISRSRALQGFESDETATFVFSLKKPLFERLRSEFVKDAAALANETWAATQLIDKLGLHTVKAFQRAREQVIVRQQQELLELSTPVVKIWEGVLALPMIGTLDSARTQVVMESLLQRIVETGSEIAIIDITGVPTVDTLVAQHLIKTITAIRLMGADCIVSGVRPQIAQTIVHLGVDLQAVTTKATLADALSLALKRSGFTVTKEKAVSSKNG